MIKVGDNASGVVRFGVFSTQEWHLEFRDRDRFFWSVP